MSFPIDVYKDIPQSEIEAVRQNSEGKEYTLNHPPELVVNMRYKGDASSSANSQGWERNSTYYFKELLNSHPEYFSKKNIIRIQNGESPRVDARFIQAFPQFEGYENETLIHHHVGKDGQAVAVPQSIHKGSGEIHLYENKLGITGNAKEFSDLCRVLCENNPEMINHTSDQFKASLEAMNTGEPAEKTDTDIHGNVDDDKQENLEARDRAAADVLDSVDSQLQEMNDDYLRQKQLREARRLKGSTNRGNYPYKTKEPAPKGLLGHIKYAARIIWDNSKEEIITGAVLLGGAATEKYIRNKMTPNNKTTFRKSYSDISMTNPPKKEKPPVDPEVNVSTSTDKEKRKSPEEHIVNTPGQRRGKDKIFVPGKPYVRPKKKDDE